MLTLEAGGMALYAMGDLHLSLGADKPMDVFGGAWEGYVDKIARGLSVLTGDDTIVLCGDLSWAMNLEEAYADFAFLASFPGRKLLVKGNHDYWWTTAAKMRRFFAEKGFAGFEILHNNAFAYEDRALCGTRGWFFEEDDRGTHDEKVFLRECARLEASLQAGRVLLPDGTAGERLLAFLHYPPLYEGYRCDGIVDLLDRFGAARCYYGHLHGAAHGRAIEGDYRGIEYTLISADYLDFRPARIL
jgi:predicted phosphohydrolase